MIKQRVQQRYLALERPHCPRVLNDCFNVTALYFPFFVLARCALIINFCCTRKMAIRESGVLCVLFLSWPTFWWPFTNYSHWLHLVPGRAGDPTELPIEQSRHQSKGSFRFLFFAFHQIDEWDRRFLLLCPCKGPRSFLIE